MVRRNMLTDDIEISPFEFIGFAVVFTCLVFVFLFAFMYIVYVLIVVFPPSVLDMLEFYRREYFLSDDKRLGVLLILLMIVAVICTVWVIQKILEVMAGKK